MATYDLDQIWALQRAQGEADPTRPSRELLVPAADPEFGPYSAYRFVDPGDAPSAGWRRLTPEEVEQVEGRGAQRPED